MFFRWKADSIVIHLALLCFFVDTFSSLQNQLMFEYDKSIVLKDDCT